MAKFAPSKWLSSLIFAALLALMVTVAPLQTHDAHAATFRQTQTANPATCFHNMIPDVNIWGGNTYLRYLSIDQQTAIYFQSRSEGGTIYTVIWQTTQDDKTFSDPQTVTLDVVWDNIVTPIGGLQIGPVNSNINNPHDYAAGVFNCDGLWYPPTQVTH